MKIPKINKLSRQPSHTPRRRLTDRDASPAEQSRGVDDGQRAAYFRRNMTITGSRSQSIRSASELGGRLQSPRAQTHHLRRRQRSLSALFAGSMLAVVGLVILIYQLTAVVSTSVYGQIGSLSTERQANYVSVIQQYLNQRPLERLRAFQNSQQLVSYMQQSGLSEVSAIESVMPDGFGATHIKLKVREPMASWTVDGVKRYVDRDGVIFTNNYFAEPQVRIIDKSGVKVDDDHGSVTSGRFLAFVGQVVGLLRDDNLDVRQVTIPSSGTRQVEFVLGNKDVIKMTIDRPAGEQAEDARVSWRYLSQERRPVRYIDVRVSGQAFYR